MLRKVRTVLGAESVWYDVPMTTSMLLSSLLLMSVSALGSVPQSSEVPATGIWRAWLSTPGGALPFGLDLGRIADGDEWRATLVNGDERIAVPRVSWDGRTLVLDITHYDSRIEAVLAPGGALLEGTWTKRRGADSWARVDFHAVVGESERFIDGEPGVDEPLTGRWKVTFATDDDAAVGEFDVDPEGRASGTFLTTTGDYRFLAGRQDGRRLRLSCFDGGHAFLFHAHMQDDGSVVGDFWSGNQWHDTWTATRAPDMTLPGAYEQTRWTGGPTSLADLTFPDLDGVRRSLADPAFAGKARILHVFGSWCPNCHDASAEMVRLAETYGDEGLSVLGLAFELTGDFERDARQVRTYAQAHGVSYPILVAGLADKSKATATLGLLDRVRSYPTTIFLHGDGRVHSVHTGFTGPATGERYTALRARFTATVEELLAE